MQDNTQQIQNCAAGTRRRRACTSARLSAWKTDILPMVSMPIHDVRLSADHAAAISISGRVALHETRRRSYDDAGQHADGGAHLALEAPALCLLRYCSCWA